MSSDCILCSMRNGKVFIKSSEMIDSDNVEWKKWAEDIRLRWKWAMDYYREELYYDIEFQQYMQFKFHEQWMKLKTYANENGDEYLLPILSTLHCRIVLLQP